MGDMCVYREKSHKQHTVSVPLVIVACVAGDAILQECSELFPWRVTVPGHSIASLKCQQCFRNHLDLNLSLPEEEVELPK